MQDKMWVPASASLAMNHNTKIMAITCERDLLAKLKGFRLSTPLALTELRWPEL